MLNKYNQTLSQRNALLKEIPYKRELYDTLYIWDEHLAKLGGLITEQRLKYFNSLNEIADKYHRGLSCLIDKMDIKYAFSYECENNYSLSDLTAALLNGLKKNREEDLQNKTTSCGIHRDDYAFFINSKNAKNFSSQGQQRTAALSLKLSEIKIIEEEKGEKLRQR